MLGLEFKYIKVFYKTKHLLKKFNNKEYVLKNYFIYLDSRLYNNNYNSF